MATISNKFYVIMSYEILYFFKHIPIYFLKKIVHKMSEKF